jgi:UDP-3-O-[3-hydroxymyristoyl] glucosamine N-acyltransferase
MGYAVCEDAVGALNEVQSRLALATSGQWQSFPSRIHPKATIMDGAYVAPNDVVIGKNVTIFPNAVIMHRSIIEEGSSIGPGTIVGTDAFEVDITAKPRRIVAQSGGVRIGRYVDIQAKCTIVRATFGGFTQVGDESKLDCQVHLAHDCRIGKGARIAACAEISGRVTMHDNVFIGPNASISNGLTIGRNAHVTIGAVVSRDVEENDRVTGNFAINHHKWLDFLRSIR